MKNKKTYSRVIIEKSGIQRRLFSLHLDPNSGDLLIEFKRPLPVIAQGTLDSKAGTLVVEKPEVLKIQHIHYIQSKHKIVVTYREKGMETKHTRGIILFLKKLMAATYTY